MTPSSLFPWPARLNPFNGTGPEQCRLDEDEEKPAAVVHLREDEVDVIE